MPAKKKDVKVERRTSKRRGEDRRQGQKPVAKERRQSERRKVQRRRQIDPTTCERDYSQVEIEFMQALDAYKRASGRMFPTCSEILEVIAALGYARLTPEELAARQATAAETAVVEPDAESEEAEEEED